MRGNGDGGGGRNDTIFCNGAEIPQMNINFFGLFNFGIFGKSREILDVERLHGNFSRWSHGKVTTAEISWGYVMEKF